MRQRHKQEHSPQIAEAVATFLVVAYLAIEYGPQNWVTVMLCVSALALITGAAIFYWKKHSRRQTGENSSSDPGHPTTPQP